MAPRWVKKRDGRIEPFDESRIVRSVLRAGRRAGRNQEVELLAREIARSVTLYLSRLNTRTPETNAIAQAVESALSDTGHATIARAAGDYRDWRRRRGAEVRVRELSEPRGASASSSPVEVLSLGAARPWTKQRIVQALVQQAELEQQSAEDVARAVEERVFAAGLTQVSTTLLRELIDAELFERGFSAQLGRLEVVGVPKEDLERLAFLGQGRSPLLLEDGVARSALERYALEALLAGRGATAHRRGDVHLLGLGRPYRLAAGGVAVADLVAPVPPGRPLPAIRQLLRSARAAATGFEFVYGLVGFASGLAPYVDEGAAALDEALGVLLDALAAPRPDDVPPAPELALVCRPAPAGSPAALVLERTLAALEERGPEGAGVRLVLRASEPEPELGPLLERLIGAARRGAGCDLVLGPGEEPASRGLRPRAAAVQLGLINLPGVALAAGRGERQRFSAGLEQAVAAALDAFHKRHRRMFSTLVRPASPLFGPGEPTVAAPGPLEADALTDALGVVGLDAALRYLVGESPAENPKVAELALEVLLELREAIATGAARLGLGAVRLEEVPEADAGTRLAALDLDRFRDARELLGEAPGWDTAASAGVLADPLADLRVRAWLNRKLGGPLYLARPVLAGGALAPAELAAGLLELLREAHGSGRPGQRRRARARPAAE